MRLRSGLDFAFVLLDLLRGDEVAKKLQLMLEYDPAPPFRSGHPDVAEAGIVDAVRAAAKPMLERARRCVVRLWGG